MQKTLAAVIVASLAVSVQAQTPTASEHIQVTLVEVPVNVVDRNGNAVRNLTVDNFQLIDSGQRRTITHFDAIDLSARAKAENAPTAATAAAGRNFLLLFDLSGSSPGTLARARLAAHTFINSSAISGDRVGVGTFTGETGFHLVTSFTSDMKLVGAAIDTLGAPRLFHPADPLLLSAIEMHASADAAAAVGTKQGEVEAENLGEKARMLDRAANDTQRQFLRRTLEGYADLARILDRVSGRKQVILLTEGFDAKLIHGRELLTSAGAVEDERLIERGEAWRVDTDNRFGNSQLGQDLAAMMEVCRRSDVVLNAIDIKGIRATGGATDAPVTSNESLFLLTHDTGGMVFKNANSLDEDFRRLLSAQEVVYVLGFEAPSSAPGKFHDLKVKLVNVPSARPLNRAGYFELSPASSAIERTLTAAEIISNQIPQSDIAVRTLATPFPRRDGAAQVPVIVEINGPSLLRAAKNNQIASDVFIYAFDEKNIIRDFVHQPIGLDVNKLRQRLQDRGVRLYETLMLPPGRYSVRTLVRAGQQSMYGYSDATIDVPSYDRTAVLGGTAVDDRPGEWVPVKPPDRNGVPGEYPFAIDGAMLVPWAAPVLRPGVAARVALYIAHMSAAPARVSGAVDGREATVRIASRSAADGTMKLLLDVVPPALPPGDYQLTLQIPELAQNVAVVPFVVR